jgi:hypothetical protein
MSRKFWKWLPTLMLSGFLITAGLPVALAATANDTINVTADMNSWITISSPADVDLGSFDRGTDSSGTADWSVATNNTAGYKLEINEDGAAPALVNDTSPTVYYFDDYNMDTTSVPTSWVVAASDAEFGFTASGTDAGSEYGSGTLYRGTDGTTPIQVATSASETSATITTVRFRAEVGSSKFLRAGGYTAVITATATTL